MPSKKVSVILTYANSGVQPPVFLAGTFSEPAWHPWEMDFTTDENGEHRFHREVQVDEGGEFEYKFRIGNGDWWDVNEEAPTVIDETGIKNNLLSVPISEKIAGQSIPLESDAPPSGSDLSFHELVAEEVNGKFQFKDHFGSNVSIGKMNTHSLRAKGAESGHTVVGSETSTPVYANIAAEVADSAAMLDREPSPVRVSDEEAGRTGERRMSSTPIPQVALTAAEVADIAMVIDQGDTDDMRMNVPHSNEPYDTPSGSATPWHERAPLFAHECLGPNDVWEEESPIINSSPLFPSKPTGEIFDFNDPLLEPFPEDRVSILTHIRSCESRMTEDETKINGVPPSPITNPKSRSPSLDTPSSAKFDSQPSPSLDMIAEERHESENHFDDILVPVEKPQDQVDDLRGIGMLNAIQEAEELTEEHSESDISLDGLPVPVEKLIVTQEVETMEEPKAVLRNLEVMKESTNDSSTVIRKDETVENLEVEPPQHKTESLQSEEPQHIEEPRQVEESMLINEPQQVEQFQMDDTNDISKGRVSVEGPPLGATTEVLDAEKASDSQELTLERNALESEAPKSAAEHNYQPEVMVCVEVDIPISRIESDNKVPAIHAKSATSNPNDLDEIYEPSTNAVSLEESTPVNNPLPNYEDDSKLKLSSTTVNLKQQPTSIHHQMEAEESRDFFQAIWQTVFRGPVGGLIARVSGSERGPLLAITAFVIFAPLLAMYFYRPEAL